MLLQDLGVENLTREAAASFGFPVSMRMITIYILCLACLYYNLQ